MTTDQPEHRPAQSQEDSDMDEPITLASDTLAILQSFLLEKKEAEEKFEKLKRAAHNEADAAVADIKKDLEMGDFAEDWQLSQFWYDEETAMTLAKKAIEVTPDGGCIACVSSPSVYVKLVKLLYQQDKKIRAYVLEFDRRFAVYGNDFVFFDFNHPVDLDEMNGERPLNHKIDTIVADPPFLSDECWTKTSVCVKWLAKEKAKIVVCTGMVMKDKIYKELECKPTAFEPKHRGGLSNDLIDCLMNTSDDDQHQINDNFHTSSSSSDNGSDTDDDLHQHQFTTTASVSDLFQSSIPTPPMEQGTFSLFSGPQWQSIRNVIQRSGNHFEKRLLELSTQDLHIFLRDGIIVNRTGFQILFNPLPLSMLYNKSLYSKKFDEITEVPRPRTTEEILAGDFAAGTRQIYKGMRAAFERCAYSRLPIRLFPEAFQLIPSNAPNKPRPGFFYFEAKFSQPSTSTSFTDEDLLATIGVVTSSYSHHHPPGCLPSSVGYSSRDGHVSLWHQYGESFQFGPRWGWGDVVGCGYIPVNTIVSSERYHSRVEGRETLHDTSGIIFFTKNGEWVGDAPHRILQEVHGYEYDWHAAVSASIPAGVDVNLGEKHFEFNQANYPTDSFPETDIDSLTNLWLPTHHLNRLHPPQHLLESYQTTLQKLGPKAYIPLTPQLPPSVDPHTSPKIFIHDSQPHVQFFNNGYAVARHIQSPAPLLPGMYFELIILSQSPSDDGFLACGLAARPYSPFHHCGWDWGSIGFHSDDLNLFDGTNQSGIPWCSIPGRVSYGEGDTIGVGLTQSGDLYFTINGVKVGVAKNLRAYREMYPSIQFDENDEEDEEEEGADFPIGSRGWCLFPTVSGSGGWEVKLNFGGEKFVYQGK
ncbi:EEF1A lysine methyltransferase 1 [Chytridiales sp. JEL 0842]|nr:EEF1A lysine methyltransferase 1 [Chytridiales sp. JEL 0842]